MKYKKQCYCVDKLNSQSKQEYFDSLNPFLDSKPFWKSCNLYFSNKHSFGDSKIALNENGKFLTENMKIAKTFTDSLELFDWPLQSNISYGKVQNIIKSFFNHPSIIKIKPKFKLNKKFSFQCVSEAKVRKVVKSLLSDKATTRERKVNVNVLNVLKKFPVNVLKNSENCFFDLTNCIKAIRNNKFLDS